MATPPGMADDFRVMVEHANDALMLVAESHIIMCNPAAGRMFGTTREALMGTHPAQWSPAHQPDGRSSAEAAEYNMRQALQGRDVQRFLWQHLRADGTPFTAEVTLTPALDARPGMPPRFVAALRDVTDTLAADAARRESEQRFKRLFELAPIPLALSTLDGRMLAHNQCWLDVLGYTHDDVPDMAAWWLKAYPDESYRQAVRGLWESAMERVLQGERLIPTEVRVRCADGQTRHLQVGGARVGDTILTSYFDLTSQRQAQAQLELLNAGLEARVAEHTQTLQDTIQNLQRTQEELVRSEKLASLGSLVAGVAHELNTPIGNAVIVASTLNDLRKQLETALQDGLRRSVLTRFLEDVRESVDVMERNLQRAAELITGFKQVAVDQSSYQRRPFDLAEVLHELQLTLSPTLRRSQVQLSHEAPAGIRMDSYPGPLNQVLMNLVNNAVTHAFDGHPAPQVHLSATPIAVDRVEIRVSDNGCGIPSEHLSRVFDPFFTTRLGQGGSGLGLHIVYSLVTELLGGTVRIDSTVGQGSTVTIQLPLTAPSHRDTPLPHTAT